MYGKKLNIAMLTPTFIPKGGMEYEVKWLAEGLAERGHKVYLFTPYASQKSLNVNKNGFPKNIPLGTNSLLNSFWLIYKFIKSVRRIKPDIIHAHYAFVFTGLIAGITKLIHRAPVVITSHGGDITLNREIKYGMRNSKITNILIKITLKLCDKHIIVSNSLKTDAIDAGSSIRKIQTIHNMFVPPSIEIPEKDVTLVKNKYNIPIDKKIILSVSRLHPKKGLTYLVEAMKEVSQDALLVVVGEGGEKEKLKKLVKNMGMQSKVYFTGFVNNHDKLALIKGCDIFCLPSIEEAFGIALFDPMYYSKPIIATNAGGIPEVLGKGEYIVERCNKNALSECITKLLSNEDKQVKLGEMLKKRLDLFSSDNIIAQYERTYFAEVSKASKKHPFFALIIRFIFKEPKRYKYLFEFIRNNQCKKIMEIGTWNGEHAMQMIEEAKKNFAAEEVKYYGFDLFELMDDETASKEYIKVPPSMESVRNKLRGTGAEIHLFRGNTRETLPQEIHKLPKMDFVFIDGGHSLRTISNDWKYVKEIVDDDTIVIFDDYWNRDDAGCKRIVERIDRTKFDVKILPIQDKFKTEGRVLKINFVQVKKKRAQT